jgi:glutamate dehydrogenase (NAD(P)+)
MMLHLQPSGDGLLFLWHPTLGTVGCLAIDRSIGGRFGGGIRGFKGLITMVEENALRQLARRMTLKYGFLQFDPRGGAKLGIVDPRRIGLSRPEFFAALGEALRGYLQHHRYAPGTDLNTTAEDLHHLHSTTSGRNSTPGKLDSAYYTAQGLFVALDVARERGGLGQGWLKVSIDGLGKVGSWIAQLASVNRCRIVAIQNSCAGWYDQEGLDGSHLRTGYLTEGDSFVLHQQRQQIQREDFYALPRLDVFFPCASSEAFTPQIAQQITARVVIPGANLIGTELARQVLRERKIHFLPDFVANSGGLLGTSLAYLQLPHQQIIRIFQHHLRAKMCGYLGTNFEAEPDLHSLAVSRAMADFESMKSHYERFPHQLLLQNPLLQRLREFPPLQRLLGHYAHKKLLS